MIAIGGSATWDAGDDVDGAGADIGTAENIDTTHVTRADTRTDGGSARCSGAGTDPGIGAAYGTGASGGWAGGGPAGGANTDCCAAGVGSAGGVGSTSDGASSGSACGFVTGSGPAGVSAAGRLMAGLGTATSAAFTTGDGFEHVIAQLAIHGLVVLPFFELLLGEPTGVFEHFEAEDFSEIFEMRGDGARGFTDEPFGGNDRAAFDGDGVVTCALDLELEIRIPIGCGGGDEDLRDHVEEEDVHLLFASGEGAALGVDIAQFEGGFHDDLGLEREHGLEAAEII